MYTSFVSSIACSTLNKLPILYLVLFSLSACFSHCLRQNYKEKYVNIFHWDEQQQQGEGRNETTFSVTEYKKKKIHTGLLASSGHLHLLFLR